MLKNREAGVGAPPQFEEFGAGTPLSVLAGRAEYMDLIANGAVVCAGTLNGNPLCLAAARAALRVLAANNGALLEHVRMRAAKLKEGLYGVLTGAGHTVVATGAGGVFQISFMGDLPRNYRELTRADSQAYSDFALALLDEGVMVLPDGRWYVSTAHSDGDMEETLEAARRAVR